MIFGSLNTPEQVFDIPLESLRGFHDNLVVPFFALGCDVVHDNDHQLAYPVLQLFDILFDGRYVLIINHELYHNFLCANIRRTSHTSIILTATPIASCSIGTGMTAAADCNSVKTCFPLAVRYFVIVGTTSREFSDDF